jgi:hypothetical protein
MIRRMVVAGCCVATTHGFTGLSDGVGDSSGCFYDCWQLCAETTLLWHSSAMRTSRWDGPLLFCKSMAVFLIHDLPRRSARVFFALFSVVLGATAPALLARAWFW